MSIKELMIKMQLLQIKAERQIRECERLTAELRNGRYKKPYRIPGGQLEDIKND